MCAAMEQAQPQTDGQLQSGDNSSQTVASQTIDTQPQKKVSFEQRFVEKLPRWAQKTVAFVSKEWLYFAVPMLIFSLFFGVLFSMDIYPFGHSNMSNYDLLAQIAPFYEHFYDVMDGKSGLFYSPAIAGGADVFGTLAYCAVSPFTFIFLFFGRTTVYNAISFVLPLKLSCVACSAIYFIKREFKNVPEHMILILSILYAYCGYMFVANTYVNWVDFLIYMPFVIIGFKKLVTQKSVKYFAISYALMIYACFSIACFALFLIFIIFVAYVILAAEKGERVELFAKMCISLVLAIAIALPLLVPALFAYLRSGRNTGLFENMGNEITPDHLYYKFSYVFADTSLLFFSLVYFIKNGLKKKQDRFLFVAFLIIMMPVFIDEVNNLMNAGSYMSYSLRFGFLNSTFALYMACKLFNELREYPVQKWVNRVATVAFAFAAVLAVLFILNLNAEIVAPDSEIGDFSGNFAHSTGGLEVIYRLVLVFSALCTLAVALYSLKLITYKNLSYVMIAVLAVQVAFYNIHLVRGNSFDPLRYDQFNAIINTIDEYDDRRYYRVKDNSSAITNDAAFITHTNSFAVFSSVIDNDNFILTNYFKYAGNQANSIECAGGTFFSDCLLGYKYFYVHTDVNDYDKDYTTLKRDYLVKLEDTQQANFCAYENIGVFPNCYTVDKGELKMDDPDFATNMQELYEFLGGKGEFFQTIKFKLGFDENLNNLEIINDEETGDVIYSFTFKTSYDGHYYIDTCFPEQFEVGYSSSTSADKKSLYYESFVDTIDYGYNVKAGGFYHFAIKSIGEKPLDLQTVIDSVAVRVITNEKVLELSNYLDTRACDYTQTANTFTIKATAENDSTYVLLNYVSIDGFEATVNGHKAEVIDNAIKYILVKLDQGENTVVVTYKSPYYKYMAIGLVMSAVIITALYLLFKKFAKIGKMFYPMICALASFIAVVVFAFFYIYPSAVFIEKLLPMLFGA